jgi:serine/threonine protein kinase
MSRGLSLEVSLNKENFDQLGATYRDEGLSIGADHMRLFGEEVQFEVSFSDLVIGSVLGKGACSSVYKAHHKRSGEKYAVKVFNVFDRTQASQLYNEILLLTSFQCDALISLKGAFHDHGSIGIILEFMDRGTLEFIKDPRIQSTELAIAGITFQMVWGLAYLHYEKQIHRDVKPGNILMV